MAVMLLVLVVAPSVKVFAAPPDTCPTGMSPLDCASIVGPWTGWLPDNGASICATNGGNGSTGGASGDFTLDQVKTFASEPITSTWNISDSTVEQWFLKQTNARSVITRFGLTSSNIGQITANIKAAGVSPVFFYVDTVNEGGGAAGFINHYSKKTDPSPLNDGPANATSDSKYIVSESQTTADGPATGGGEPSGMPTAEAKAILDALPKGSLGVYYIQATSAVTAELEDLSGKGPTDSYYGHPLTDSMKNITKMGGDPLQGGATIATDGCTAGVTGVGMQKGINFAIAIANNNGYGYDLPTRESGYPKWLSDPSCTHACASFDCSSFISAILTVAGYFDTDPNFGSGSEADALTQKGFTKVFNSVKTSAGLRPGDIMVWDGHTEMYIGNDQAVAAHINENGSNKGGQVGDQNGREISVEPFEDSLSSDPWIGVYRAPQ